LPLVNIFYFVTLSGKRHAARMIALPIATIGVSLLLYSLLISLPAGSGVRVIPLLIFLILGLGVIAGCIWLLISSARIMSVLAVRCGRPWWWGPLMILVPPVGLVLLGIMAWSKPRDKSQFQLSS
ncbi:MAG: hypothetical protein AAB855_05285, partial [Patescibacteria group bacterium]